MNFETQESRLNETLVSGLVGSFVVRVVIHVIGAVFAVARMASFMCVVVVLWFVGVAISMCCVVTGQSVLFTVIAVLLFVV